MTKQAFRPFASAGAVSARLFPGQTLAKSDIAILTQPEPPHLGPISAAAQAIDSGVFTNILQGQIHALNKGSASQDERKNVSSTARDRFAIN